MALKNQIMKKFILFAIAFISISWMSIRADNPTEPEFNLTRSTMQNGATKPDPTLMDTLTPFDKELAQKGVNKIRKYEELEQEAARHLEAIRIINIKYD